MFPNRARSFSGLRLRGGPRRLWPFGGGKRTGASSAVGGERRLGRRAGAAGGIQLRGNEEMERRTIGVDNWIRQEIPLLTPVMRVPHSWQHVMRRNLALA